MLSFTAVKYCRFLCVENQNQRWFMTQRWAGDFSWGCVKMKWRYDTPSFLYPAVEIEVLTICPGLEQGEHYSPRSDRGKPMTPHPHKKSIHHPNEYREYRQQKIRNENFSSIILHFLLKNYYFCTGSRRQTAAESRHNGSVFALSFPTEFRLSFSSTG